MTRQRRRMSLGLAVIAAAAVTIGAPVAAQSAPVAHAAATCSVRGKERTFGPTYVTKLTVSGGATCAGGKAIVRAYYRCRVQHGGKTRGRCASVSGYRCTEKRYDAIPTQFSAHVTCTAGKRRVLHDYTQFT